MDLRIDRSVCNRCKRCEKVCLLVNNFGFQSIREAPEHYCIGCGHCAAVCPTGAISRPFTQNLSVTPDHLPAPESVVNLIKANRTVRNYKPTPIPDNVWQAFAQVARYSSSGMNFQETEAIFIKDRILIRKISRAAFKTLEIMKRAYTFYPTRRALSYSLSPLALKYLEVNSSRGSYPDDGSDPVLYNAPGLIILSGPKRFASAKDDSDIMAVNINLTAASFGLGCCYIGSIPHSYMLNNRSLKKLIPLQKNYTVYQTMTLGYPSQKKTHLPNRKEVHRFLS